MIVKNEEEVLLHDKLHRSMSRSLEPKDYFKKSRLRIIPRTAWVSSVSRWRIELSLWTMRTFSMPELGR